MDISDFTDKKPLFAEILEHCHQKVYLIGADNKPFFFSLTMEFSLWLNFMLLYNGGF